MTHLANETAAHGFLFWGVLFFLAASLFLYILFAGADFGAGILEIFLGSGSQAKTHDRERQLITHAMAPVWEANHVWLILAVVILFVGFPTVYTSISVYLHIPILAVLMGIVARGCAFTFRHYDTLTKEFYELYSKIFAYSSLWTSFFIGLTAGAMTLGRIEPAAPDYPTLYIAPWFSTFGACTGLFTSCMFTFLASVFLVGEAEEEDLKQAFVQKSKFSAIAVVVTGSFVFIAAEMSGLPLAQKFFTPSLSLACFVLASLLWIPFWLLLRGQQKSTTEGTVRVRALGVAIVALVLTGWFAVQFPVVLKMEPQNLTFMTTVAPEATLRSLFIALITGSFLIFPALGYLLRIFKWETFEHEE